MHGQPMKTLWPQQSDCSVKRRAAAAVFPRHHYAAPGRHPSVHSLLLWCGFRLTARFSRDEVELNFFMATFVNAHGLASILNWFHEFRVHVRAHLQILPRVGFVLARIHVLYQEMSVLVGCRHLVERSLLP